jgi:diketogulonate reductase-like aldo/keto reductase
VVVIPGASSVEQLEQNVAAVDLDLTPDEQAELTAAARAFTPQSAGRTLVDGAKGKLGQLRGRLGV